MISWAKILKECAPVTIDKYKTVEGKIAYSASLGKPNVRVCGERWEDLQLVISEYLKNRRK